MKIFFVNVTAIGQVNGSAPSAIKVSSLVAGVHVAREPQNSLAMCQPITMTVFSQPNTTTVVRINLLETNPVREKSNYHHLSELKVTLMVAECPWLFQLKATSSCDCNNIILDTHCDINNMTIRK